MLPNVLIVGAAKCGTTSLHEYLDLHPEVAMSREKELDFFVEEKNWARGIEWYEAQFAAAAAAVQGESSPSYSAYPRYKGVPARIRQVVPDARLIYLVRDPIDRIVSHFLHRQVVRPGTLEDAFADAGRREGLIGPSRYWLQLDRYLDHFSEQQILVVDSDDLRIRRDETLARIFAFVGVDPGFRAPEFAAIHNAAAQHSRPTRVGRVVAGALLGALGAERALGLRSRAPVGLKAPFRRRIQPPGLSAQLREQLAEELRGDVERLRAHTGQAFAGWSL
jgi:hypothetical protein